MNNVAELTKGQRKAIKYHARNLQELAAILGIEVTDLPKIFQSHGKRVFKIGIHADLAAKYPEADADQLSIWFAKWTGLTPYLYRIVNGKHRHDLDGNDVAMITDEDRKHAQARLDKRARRKTQRQQEAA
ncbi:MAG TPA: ProQ/FINO family protein [Hyphomicrobiales bacterium]|nr:ProQ/FINO family protein [Hyphomicrobiales bacterium]